MIIVGGEDEPSDSGAMYAAMVGAWVGRVTMDVVGECGVEFSVVGVAGVPVDAVGVADVESVTGALVEGNLVGANVDGATVGSGVGLAVTVAVGGDAHSTLS